MITRKIGAVLRGQATPFQLFAACVLGAMLGFAPGFAEAPALLVLLVAALLVVNANLGLALLVAGTAKLLSFALAPLSFRIGRELLDGPTRDLARRAVNAPVLAWCGLDTYAVTGGQVLGLLVGSVAGLCVVRSVVAFRRRLVGAGENESRLAALAVNPLARFALWLCFGGKGKRSWEQKLEKRVGNPVRLWGAALLVLLMGSAYAVQASLAGPYAEPVLGSQLARLNGATVDLEGLELDLARGRFAITGLALADPDALDRDRLRLARVEADFGQLDLARRRLHLTRVVVRDVESDVARATAGTRVGADPTDDAEPSEDEPGGTLYDPRTLGLEDVLAEYELWSERLTRARDLLEGIAGDGADAAGGREPAEETGDTGETLAEALERQAREAGWFTVRSEGLRDAAPAFRLSELVVDGLVADCLPGRLFDLRATELSTHPARVDGPPRIELASRDGDVQLELDLAPVSGGGGEGGLRLAWKGLSVDEVLTQLRLPGAAPLRGGTLDLALDGGWDRGLVGWIDLPLTATFRGTSLVGKGIEPLLLDEFELPIGLRGPIDALRVRFDHEAFLATVATAGERALTNRLRGRAERELEALAERHGIELPESLSGVLPEDLAGELAGQLEERLSEELVEPVLEQAVDDVARSVEGKLGDRLPGDAKKALGGLFGRKP